MPAYIQFRAFIGPKFLPITDPTNYPYYTALAALDATIDLDYATAVLTTLTSGTVTLVTTNSSTLYNKFPSQGGLWLGPNGSNQGWEYVGYTGRSSGSFTGLVRESTLYREHNGVHTAGAAVRFWYPIESDNGVFNFTEQLTPNLAARYWRIELGGFALPPSLLRNDHMIAICYRLGASGDWKFFCLALSDSSQIRDDWERRGEWILYANSLHGLAEKSMIHGIQVGELNVAPYGRAFGSVPLGSPYKDLLSGDYVAAEPDFSPDSAIDNSMDTLFISDYMVGTQVDIDETWDAPTQLYINPHLGRGPAYKWVELTNFTTDSADLHVYDPDTGISYALDFSDVTADGDLRLILTDDPVTFARENPAHQATAIIDVTNLTLGATFMKHCNPLGGAMAISELTGKTHIIMWGNVDVGEVEDYWDLGPTQWVGTAIPAPGYGQTIAFKHDYELEPGEDSKNKWALRNYGTPGYNPRPDRPENAWLAVYLPGLGLVLRDDVLTAATTVYIVDASGEPSTEGLPESGTLQVGSDQFTYTGKETDRVTGCSGVLSHSSGDIVYVVEDGIATDGYPIKQFILRRSGGTIHNKDFYIRYSRVLARLPIQSDHEEDYNDPYGGYYHATTGSTADFVVTLDDLGDATMRLRTVLIEFRKMTTEPSYAKLNELQALAETSYFSPEYHIAPPADAGSIISGFLKLAGVPNGAIGYSGVSLDLERSFRTAREWCWKAVIDFADMHNLFVSMERNAKVQVYDGDFYTVAVGSVSADYSWDEDDVIYAQKVMRSTGSIGQIRLAWETPDGSESGVANYPASVSERGEIRDMGPYIFADAADAELSARKRYWLARTPYMVVVELVALNLSIRAGQFFNLSWKFTGENVSLNRLYIVTGVDIRIMAERAVMVVTGLQIDREVNW